MARTIWWQPGAFIFSLLVAALLLGTYFAPATGPIWHALDVKVAFALNGLAAGPVTNHLWAFGNMKAYDYGMAVIMLLVLLHYVFRGRQYTQAVRVAQFVVICIMLVGLAALAKNVISDWFADVNSPSLSLHPFTMIANATGLDVKDSSHQSFPGDHATVVATFVYLLWAFAGRRYGLAALLVAIIACMPRLVAGAHWLTDDVVGGLGMACLTVPWVMFTPIRPLLVNGLSALFERIPLFRNHQSNRA